MRENSATDPSHPSNHAVASTVNATPQRLDDAVNRVDVIRADLNAALRDLAADDNAPMFMVVDVVNALFHLRHAAVLLDQANDRLEAALTEVAR